MFNRRLGAVPGTLAVLGTFALVVGLSSGWLAAAAGPRPGRPPDLIGAVAAGGAIEPASPGAPASGIAGVIVRHPAAGRYVVDVGDAADDLELLAWDVAADAVVTPAGTGRFDIAFARAGAPVDTRFTFELRLRTSR
jgi:hypothetical protein